MKNKSSKKRTRFGWQKDAQKDVLIYTGLWPVLHSGVIHRVVHRIMMIHLSHIMVSMNGSLSMVLDQLSILKHVGQNE